MPDKKGSFKVGKSSWQVGLKIMPNKQAKNRKRKRRKLNKLLKQKGRTANQIRKKRRK
jgi:hypothetical protein